MSQREGAVCPVRPSFTPVDSPSQTNWFAKVQAASPACFAYRTLPGDTIKSGQANRGAQRGLAGSKSKLHTPLTSVWFERSLCVWENSRRIQSFIKGHYFSTALNTHLHTNWDWRGEKKNWGLHRIVYCACKIYVLWSPAINTHCFSIKVHINPLILPPLEIRPLLRQTDRGNQDFCSSLLFLPPYFPSLVANVLLLWIKKKIIVGLVSLMCSHRTLLLVVCSLAFFRTCAWPLNPRPCRLTMPKTECVSVGLYVSQTSKAKVEFPSVLPVRIRGSAWTLSQWP